MPGDSGNSGSISRLYTLVYKMYNFFKKNSSGEVTGFTLTNNDIQKAVYPNYYIIGDGVKKITMATTPPLSPEVGDIWIDTS